MKKILLLSLLFLLVQTGIGAESKKDTKTSGTSPYKFELEQNYPNPFNPETTIKYTIEKEEYVSLKIFNLIGQEIKTVVSEVKTPGVHQVRVDGSDIPSGIYFYTLRTENFTQTKRMMLVK